MTSEHYTIKDLERLSGVRAHTIRTWEQRYGLFTPGRTPTNIRRYSADDLKNIINISLLNRSGYKISVLSAMTQAERERLSAELLQLEDKPKQHDQDLLLALLEMDERHFEETMNRLSASLGFEQTISSVVFPFFEKIGQLWQAGTVDPAQEHFFSNLVRNRLAAETLKLPPNYSNEEMVLLFLPAEELHELALQFYNYSFRLRGYRTCYLGAALPFASVERAVELHRPGIIVTGLTTALSVSDEQAFTAALCAVAPAARIFFTGPRFGSGHAFREPNAFSTSALVEFLKLNPAN
ncbi:MerR family transcriptional regulator [Pedobacter yulinensis]|uniref:MerR family transcriptional regulator n=1 Tax=Pedobacter yulinensis TaxID=2126353 RepID=A0A2T3HKC1_9SPHI|nr:MerR family transcriptional regulator [Pedobacter yulinensis]PST82831.1 MerR family transcriptional regulator [Pedobacter yulinensis]